MHILWSGRPFTAKKFNTRQTAFGKCCDLLTEYFQLTENKKIYFVAIFPDNTANYYSIIVPFYHIRAKERTKYASYYTVEQDKNYGLKEEHQNGRTKLYFISE